MGSLSLCRRIEFPVISDPRGNLTFIEGDRHVSFPIKRIYYLFDVPTNQGIKRWQIKNGVSVRVVYHEFNEQFQYFVSVDLGPKYPFKKFEFR